MLRIERAAERKAVVFTLSGRIEAEGLTELQRRLEAKADDHSMALDLKEVKLVDREVVSFLGSCEAKGIKLANCPAYIREWIEQEGGSK
jgi:ABC-type transporter Mla MlaB component